MTAGVGGQEAMLFTKELFDMYINYAKYRGWSVDSVDCEESDIGMLKLKRPGSMNKV